MYLFIYLTKVIYLQHFIYHCSYSNEQEVSEAFQGLFRTPPLLNDKKKILRRCIKINYNKLHWSVIQIHVKGLHVGKSYHFMSSN